MIKKTIDINYLARVEGRGALNISILKDGEIEDLKFRIYEPPRFFEAFLIGRKFDEIMELTSRICGICPVAHQITALRAIENALNVEISQQTKDLRKLLAISGHIQSNTLSMYFLSLPDLLGYESIIAMAGDHSDVVKRALRIKKLGNDITDLIGGRAVHPVTAVVGGFTQISNKKKFQNVQKRLKEVKKDAFDTVELFSKVEIPIFERNCEHMAIGDPHEYAINHGRLKSTAGLDIDEEEYRDYISEDQVPYSTALHSHVNDRNSFMCGPLPRVNLNFNQLSPDAMEAANQMGIKFPNFNPFVSHLARAIELVHDIDESIDLINRLTFKDENKNIELNAGLGCAITEAPRGFLYHSYELDKNGIVRGADIVPPTAHNAKNIEKDLREFIPNLLDLSIDEIALKGEMLIRAYDPCISCSSH